MDFTSILQMFPPKALGVIYAALFLVSAIGHVIPEPTTKSSKWYTWLHNAIQLLALNFALMKMPNMPPPADPPKPPTALKAA